MQVASPEGFAKNPELVLEFYNQRRRQLLQVGPNEGHKALVQLEDYFHVDIITQNVDNLHEQAGSSKVLHLHGELFKVRSTVDENLVLDWKKDLVLGDFDENGNQLRPNIVWFGELVPMLEPAIKITQKTDILVIIGTSMQVYPAASLATYINPGTPIYFIDPKPSVNASDFNNLTLITENASTGVPKLVKLLIA